MTAISLKDFGSYTVGGRVHEVVEGTPRDIQFTRSARYTYDPRGHFSVEHAYVQYFVPAHRNSHPPILLVHGGGMHGSTWETTPDGRTGWLNELLRHGHEVHVIDNVERGRSGFMPNLWDGEPLLRSHEEAWQLFRIGSKTDFHNRRPFAGSQFPVSSFDSLCQRFVPRWLTTTPLHVAAVCAALETLGEAIVMCHSQGGEIATDAMAIMPERFTALVAIEPSAFPQLDSAWLRRPTVILGGDYLDSDAQWSQRKVAWQEWVRTVQTSGIPAQYLDPDNGLGRGNTHLPMFDKNSKDVLATSLDALNAVM